MPRPLATVNERFVEMLAKHHLTTKEIAFVIGCSVTTLNHRFRSTIDRGRALAVVNLHELQWKSAMRGNVRMLIHLGKHTLGQTEQGLRTRTDYASTIGDSEGIVLDRRRQRTDEPDNEADEMTVAPLPTEPETPHKTPHILPFVTWKTEEYEPMVANFR